MSAESPNSLQPPKAAAVKMRKWPLYVAMLALVGLFGVLYYSVNFSHKKEKEQKKEDVITEEKPLASLEGRGLSLEPPKNSPAVAGSSVATLGKKADQEKLLVVRDEKDPAREADRQEEANLRRQKAQAYAKALSSPLLAKRTSETASQQKQPEVRQTAATRQPAGDQPGSLDPASMAGMGKENAYDPAADRDKEGFFKRADHNEWLSPHTREAGRPFEIKTGTVIPGVMVSGVNSDLPGSLIAQVSQNVYDTGTGRQLLLPQGSKLYGTYDSRVIYGQSRVLIAWNRVIFPDGSSVTLGAMPGADMSGYAGFEDQVNNHYMRIFGSAMLMSLITGGTSYATDSMSNNSNSGTTGQATTVQSAMASALATQLGQTTQTLLQKNLNIKPTLEIRPGYPFNVVVTKDVVFRSAYK